MRELLIQEIKRLDNEIIDIRRSYKITRTIKSKQPHNDGWCDFENGNRINRLLERKEQILKFLKGK